MPRPRKGPRLGNSPQHERKILANLTASLIAEGKVETTLAKAKAVRPLAEKIITKAGKGDLIPLDHIELRGLGHTGDERDFHYFLLLLDQPTKPKLNDENSEYRWFDQHNLPLSLNRATSEAIRRGFIEKAIAYAEKHKSKTILA